MCSLIDRLKADARQLQRAAQDGNEDALKRLRGSRARPLRPAIERLDTDGPKRRQCLTAVARELGFNGWQHLMAVLEGREDGDFGTLLYPPGPAAYWNVWSVSYDEASNIRQLRSGYLLAYKRDLFVCDSHFIDNLGVHHEDEDWEFIGRDWVRPQQPEARRRLYEKVIQVRRARQATA